MCRFYLYVRALDLISKTYKVVKIGITNDIVARESTYKTGEYLPGEFTKVYDITYNGVRCQFDKHFKKITKEYHRYEGSGIEFYSEDLVEKMDSYINKVDNIEEYRLLEDYELLDIKRKSQDLMTDPFKDIEEPFKDFKEYDEPIKDIILKDSEKPVKDLKDPIKLKTYTWSKRDYQETIIAFSKIQLTTLNKIYIELPTGAGKSFIVFNIFDYLIPNFILILSPRKIINSQNSSDKYLGLLKKHYSIFDYSIQKDNLDKFLQLISKKILIVCTQSIDKVYEKLINNNIINITVWFDEAHWGIEDWVYNDNKKFWLVDNKHITNRIFTSASPNKYIIKANEDIFGKLYSPITVKELIELNWLARIEPYIYSENKENVDNIKYILEDFKEKNRTFGFCFHNKQQNAFNLFYKHYLEYSNKKTIIKPFLLVSDNFNIDREPRLNDIILQYNFRDINVYEKSNNSIGYVVAKYSIGYDFNKIDFISLIDPKMSFKDIIQSIGRGIRPYEFLLNMFKTLVVSLPVYIDETDNGGGYEVIINVLNYLINDIGISINNIEFKNRYKSKETEETDKLEHSSKEYNGINDIKSIFIDLLELENKKVSRGITYSQAIKIIKEKDIKWISKEQYYHICDTDNRLSKEPEKLFEGQFTNWVEYLSIPKIYYDLKTCKEKVNELIIKYPELKIHTFKLSELCKELCNKDSNFPPIGLWVDYYKVSTLENIIKIPKKKLLKK